MAIECPALTQKKDEEKKKRTMRNKQLAIHSCTLEDKHAVLLFRKLSAI